MKKVLPVFSGILVALWFLQGAILLFTAASMDADLGPKLSSSASEDVGYVAAGCFILGLSCLLIILGFFVSIYKIDRTLVVVHLILWSLLVIPEMASFVESVRGEGVFFSKYFYIYMAPWILSVMTVVFYVCRWHLRRKSVMSSEAIID